MFADMNSGTKRVGLSREVPAAAHIAQGILSRADGAEQGAWLWRFAIVQAAFGSKSGAQCRGALNRLTREHGFR